jgi:hypothetical protein
VREAQVSDRIFQTLRELQLQLVQAIRIDLSGRAFKKGLSERVSPDSTLGVRAESVQQVYPEVRA